jgi:hypothetical protein
LAGGVLGALALDRSGALAKNDKDKSEKAEAKPEKPEQGGGNPEQGGRPIISPAKPVCRELNGVFDTGNCPMCKEARFGEGVAEDDASVCKDRDGAGCCDPNGREKDCKNCQCENATYCSAINDGHGTCVTTTCVQVGGQLRCNYEGINSFCHDNVGVGTSCCPIFTSPNFGHCVTETDPKTQCVQV